MTTHDHRHEPLPADVRERLGRRARRLALLAVAYNVVEAVVAIGFGSEAGSVALLGFGLGAVLEVSSGLVILWQYGHELPESREQQATRTIAVLFFALAAWITVDAVVTLARDTEPDTSWVGVALGVTSLVIMPFLWQVQRRTGQTLHSNAVVADSAQKLLCTWMTVVLLAGLLLHAVTGWSWADPVAGFGLAALALREGQKTWRGEGCCSVGH
jgi:divalent metal cation (Fe/Co/Zn/Cd) transporter